VGCEQLWSGCFVENLTMLFVRLLKHRLVVQKLLDLGEQRRLLIVMVGFDELEPGKTVANKVCLILVGNKGGLVIYRIVTAENRIV
jgi:hypothetical protein